VKYAAILIGLCLLVVLAGAGYVGYMFHCEAKALAPLGNLGALRAILEIHKEENNGYPRTLEELRSKYLREIPTLRLPDHAKSREVVYYGDEACEDGKLRVAALPDDGNWGYVSDSKSACFGKVFIACLHGNKRIGLYANQ